MHRWPLGLPRTCLPGKAAWEVFRRDMTIIRQLFRRVRAIVWAKASVAQGGRAGADGDHPPRCHDLRDVE
jgi:hypothetical protein